MQVDTRVGCMRGLFVSVVRPVAETQLEGGGVRAERVEVVASVKGRLAF